MDDWNRLAGWWVSEADHPAYQEEVIPLFRRMLRTAPGEVLLDLGCGDGRIQDLVRDMAGAPGVVTVGVDLSPELARAAARRHPVVRSRLPDLGCIRDGAADGAYVVLVLEHIRDTGRFYAEVARVVRPGGRLTMVINHPVYTAPGSGPVIDPADGELFWRFGRYLSPGASSEPAGDGQVEFRHRPIGMLLTAAASAGWLLEEVREQGVGPAAAARDDLLGRHGDIPHLMGLRWRRGR